MREKKWRAYHPDNSEMHYFPRFTVAADFIGGDEQYRDLSGEHDGGVTWMDYSGLNDGNVDIYEGDLLIPEHYGRRPDFIREVIFQDGMYCLRPNKYNREIYPLAQSLKLGERAGNRYIVIGNICENPELIKEKK